MVGVDAGGPLGIAGAGARTPRTTRPSVGETGPIPSVPSPLPNLI